MNFFNSIKKKVWLCVNVAFFGFLVATLSMLYSNTQVSEHLAITEDFDFPLAQKSTRVLNLFKEQKALYEEGYLVGQAESVAEANRLGIEILAVFDEMLSLKGDARYQHMEEHRGCDKLIYMYREYFDLASRLYPVLARGEDPTTRLEEVRKVGLFQTELLAKLTKSAEKYNKTVIDDLAFLKVRARYSNIFLINLFALVLLVTLILVNYVGNRMLIRPLGHIKEMVGRFGRGETIHPPEMNLESRDEIAQLGSAFLQMTENLLKTTVSKAYVDNILENMRDGLVVVGEDLNIKTVNKALLDMLGYEQGKALGEQIDAILVTAGEGRATPATLVCQNEERKFRASDGRQIPILFSGTELFDGDGHTQGYVCVGIDITDLKRAQMKIEEQHRFLNNIFDSIQHPFYVVNVADYTISMSNSVFRPEGGLGDVTCHQLTHDSPVPCRGEEHICPLKEVVRTKEPVTTEHLHGDRIFEVHGYPIFDAAGEVVQMIEYSLDITERKEAERRLAQLAEVDFLTGLPNRKVLHDNLKQALALARRQGQRVGVLFLDLDRFKVINDSLGHTFGDLLLKSVGQRLAGCLRESDIIARFGGDEFVVILPGMVEEKDASLAAERIIEGLEEPIEVEGHTIFCSTSIGIAVYPHDGSDPEALLKNADTAMYLAKGQGGGCYQFFSREMDVQTQDRLNLENQMRRALQQKDFLLHFQPQFDIRNHQVIGSEALVRWKGGDGELIPPGRFIPLAEETGLIIPLGEWILRSACAQNKAWQRAGLKPTTVAVNISGRQLQQDDFIGMVERVLEETGLDAKYLELELTESTIIQNVQKNILILRRLKEMGISLAIDDFGTGYSSLSYLKDFPIDRLKIDRAFIRHIGERAADEAFAKAIIAMSRSLGVEVLAEGVEARSQLVFLQLNECHHAQGFFLGKPLPADEFTALLESPRDLIPSLSLVKP
ncbi:MAG: hypothetical protein C0617_15600 [Desulfuromonas sp.]|uniref:EAL domain-containing protein n=1 Tax=Desulfuromonas sp. TaxID=892 RepID=UPI000CA7A565|nr:EAL domain-containing protein [Desulfuromonas sp.]PLX81942.1 MAG: hypothetical protein C0617_15600 [Desulfuromonas sp.]